MKHYLVSTLLCNYFVLAETPELAYLKLTTKKTFCVEDMFIGRKELLEEGYKTITKLRNENVYLLEK